MGGARARRSLCHDLRMASPTFDHLRVDVDGVRADLVLNRPEQLNPLSTQTLLDIEAAARWLDTQRDVRVVVVRGAGRAFGVEFARGWGQGARAPGAGE